jgi:hypothetical protein
LGCIRWGSLVEDGSGSLWVIQLPSKDWQLAALEKQVKSSSMSRTESSRASSS